MIEESTILNNLDQQKRSYRKEVLILGLFFVSFFSFIFSLMLLITSITDFNILLVYLGIDLEVDLSELETISYIIMYFSLFFMITSIFLMVQLISKKIDKNIMKVFYIFSLFSIPIILILIKGGIL